MDRISFTQHTAAPAAPAMPDRLREMKPMALPAARLRLADQSDTVELSGAAMMSGAAGLTRLVAARVEGPVRPTSPDPFPASAPAKSATRAMRFYADPSDQNAAATLGAGSRLDVLA